MTRDVDELLRADAIELAADAAAYRDRVASTVEPPGLADVVARLHRIAPELATEDVAEAAVAMDELPAVPPERAAAIGGLDSFIEAARAHADALAEDRTAQPIPPLPTIEPRPKRWRWAVGLAVAAAVVLVPLSSPSLRAVVFDERSRDDYSAAPLRAADTGATPERARKREVAPPQAAEIAPESEPVPEQTEPDLVPDEMPPRVEPAERAAVASPTRLADRLAELDARARAAWKRGDLRTAQQVFGKLVRIGGRREIVELAYGDLFSVARQRSDAASLRRYWKEYAAKFPEGHYVDDARAGLCRTSSGERKLRCWRGYLRDRPGGTYRRDAEAALEAAGGNDGSSALRCREDGGRGAAAGACPTVDGGGN